MGRVWKPEKNDLLKHIMDEMEKRNFTVGEAEEMPERLGFQIKRNSERFEKEKPFTVYKD